MLVALLDELGLGHHAQALQDEGFDTLDSLGVAVAFDLVSIGLSEEEAAKLLGAPMRMSRSLTTQLMETKSRLPEPEPQPQPEPEPEPARGARASRLEMGSREWLT